MLQEIAILAAALMAALGALCAGYFSAAAICVMTPGGLSHAWADMLDYFRAAKGQDDYRDARRARQLVIVMSSSGLVAIVNVINVLVVASLLLNSSASLNVIWWALFIILLSGFQLEGCIKMRGRAVGVDRAPAILRRLIRNVSILGAAWGAGGMFFVPESDASLTMLLIVALIGIASGGVATLAALPPAAILFAAVMAAPVLARIVNISEPVFLMLAPLTLVFLFTLGAIVSGVYNAIVKRTALESLGEGASCAGVACVDLVGRRIA
jgi:hypothetical protein